MSSLKNTYLLSLASSLGSISAACFVAGGGLLFHKYVFGTDVRARGVENKMDDGGFTIKI